ncbi:2-dehydro-3-deoxyphosphogluconate aldolase [Mucilaginibacter hurinus]|uniref:2-dehydro-3-deoxyphosphogluconate aldolase n=1 Tax=Mucilaginibacter hurinus TaxID=2201324 RepID=A0A367GRY3_9SPHI|nr:bifunctional 4-hydroxy-2-oxoglutarate aldolase/2-dehydro-3-deoxy-phosphogluconate aldolase [Mucilaginibacter hurinus]RCH56030.1 2-dehydro-3-deoxyphosphogluconate aldolase [Mucilaginibacter hurinus]
MSTLEQILEHKIVAIIRGADPNEVSRIAEALYAGGIRILEITLNSASPLAVIKKVSERMGDRMVIGAGTVLEVQEACDAVAAGAKFVLSPVVDQEVIRAAKDLGVVSIPGAYTATEVYRAYKCGADIVKVFPATSPAYIKDLTGPLPQIPLLPTGGISLQNIAEYKKAGAVGFGMGTALVNTKLSVTEQYLADITANAKMLVEAIKA